jgi:hypothetical protein
MFRSLEHAAAQHRQGNVKSIDSGEIGVHPPHHQQGGEARRSHTSPASIVSALTNWETSAPVAKQVSLVSLYGEKRGELAELICQSQELVERAIREAFTPFDPSQVHATIISLERDRPPANCANFAKHRRCGVSMDFQGFLSYLQACGHIPFEAQIGGFGPGDHPFTSRRASPYERSFSVQGDKIVMMGWPLRRNACAASQAGHARLAKEPATYPPTLDRIRQDAQNFGILHSYHRTPTDHDNDLFFRIGSVEPTALTANSINALESQARHALAMRQPVVVNIGFDDLFVVAYEDVRLPRSSTRAWPLTDPRVTGDFVLGLFAPDAQ